MSIQTLHLLNPLLLLACLGIGIDLDLFFTLPCDSASGPNLKGSSWTPQAGLRPPKPCHKLKKVKVATLRAEAMEPSIAPF